MKPGFHYADDRPWRPGGVTGGADVVNGTTVNARRCQAASGTVSPAGPECPDLRDAIQVVAQPTRLAAWRMASRQKAGTALRSSMNIEGLTQKVVNPCSHCSGRAFMAWPRSAIESLAGKVPRIPP